MPEEQEDQVVAVITRNDGQVDKNLIVIPFQFRTVHLTRLRISMNTAEDEGTMMLIKDGQSTILTDDCLNKNQVNKFVILEFLKDHIDLNSLVDHLVHQVSVYNLHHIQQA